MHKNASQQTEIWRHVVYYLTELGSLMMFRGSYDSEVNCLTLCELGNSSHFKLDIPIFVKSNVLEFSRCTNNIG